MLRVSETISSVTLGTRRPGHSACLIDRTFRLRIIGVTLFIDRLDQRDETTAGDGPGRPLFSHKPVLSSSNISKQNILPATLSLSGLSPSSSPGAREGLSSEYFRL